LALEEKRGLRGRLGGWEISRLLLERGADDVVVEGVGRFGAVGSHPRGGAIVRT